jgi:hypothetical protein
VHLALVGEELQKEFLKAAVKIPVYTADIVTHGVLAVIREFNGLTVCTHKVLSSEKACKISAQL